MKVADRNDVLVKKINDYRSGLGKPALKCHWALVRTAYIHTKNQNDHPPSGRCNGHSWLSTKYLGDNAAKKKTCCQPSDFSNRHCMWNKPRELTEGGSSLGNGYEIIYQSKGFSVSASSAFYSWIKSKGHRAVLAGEGNWNDLDWIGCYYEGGFGDCWFGKSSEGFFGLKTVMRRQPLGY